MIPTVVESVELEAQRYFTLGDYFIKDGVRYFRITKIGDDLMDDLVFLHEFVEELLTRHRNIPEEEIFKFDLWVENEIEKGNYPDDAEPGAHKLSPYKKEHLFAEKIERMVAKELKINWENYNKELNEIIK